MRTWFTMQAADNNAAEIAIYDEIGFWGINASDFRDQLVALGDVSQINLRINSPGGNVFDGLAIYNMLSRHKAKVTVTVDGIAASIASMVAMAGDIIEMPENSMMMIHNPSGLVMGTAQEMRDLADILDKLRSSVATSYVAKSKLKMDDVIALMDAETWLSAKEAKDKGMADVVTGRVEVKNTFDLSRYAKAPAIEAKAVEIKVETTTAVATTNDREAAVEIAAACQLAGFSEKAADFIASGKSLVAVMAELRTMKADRGTGQNEIVNTGPVRTANLAPSWDKVVGRVNARIGG